MKKLIILFLFLSSSVIYSQDRETYLSVSVKADIQNSVVGSKPTNNNPSLDAITTLHMVKNNFELGVGDELFKEIGFNRFFINLGYHIKSYAYNPLTSNYITFYIIPNVGASMIDRFGTENRWIGEHFVYGKNTSIGFQTSLSFRFKVSERVILEFMSEFLTRPDLKLLYPTDPNKFAVLSNYAGVHYIIK